MPDRPFSVVDVAQRSPEWFQARCGLVTGTAASDMLAKTLKSGGEPACRRDLRVRLALERVTNVPDDGNGFVSADMRRGTELEPEAFAAYEASTGHLVQQVGFLRHNDLPIGCSPDGIVGDFDGGVELKVPKSATHLRYLQSGNKAPAEHVAQLTHFLYLTGLSWVDFTSYDPRFPESARLYIVRLKAEDVDLKGYGEALTAFLAEVQKEQDDMIALIAARAA